MTSEFLSVFDPDLCLVVYTCTSLVEKVLAQLSMLRWTPKIHPQTCQSDMSRGITVDGHSQLLIRFVFVCKILPL